MNSSKPYILKALYEWISDNDCTPLILVNSLHKDVQIPPNLDEDGKVVLNISMNATQNLNMEDGGVSFDARFSGKSNYLYIPNESILAIYTRENGQGMMFEEENSTNPDPSPKPSKPEIKLEKKDISKDKNFLKVVK